MWRKKHQWYGLKQTKIYILSGAISATWLNVSGHWCRKRVHETSFLQMLRGSVSMFAASYPLRACGISVLGQLSSVAMHLSRSHYLWVEQPPLEEITTAYPLAYSHLSAPVFQAFISVGFETILRKAQFVGQKVT